jgi:integrase/recombinase XerD
MRSTKPKDAKLETDDQPELAAAIREVAGVFRRYRLDYHQSAYVVRRARAAQEIQKERPTKCLPKVLTDQQVTDFFAAVKRGGNSEHLLMFQILWSTGLRVSEFCDLQKIHVDVENLSIRVEQGKGSKDRTVLIPDQIALAMRLHLDADPKQRFLFETNRRTGYSVRYVQHLVKTYGDDAGIENLHPHRFRHTILTALTRAKLTDAQIQLISGHSSKKALEIYQAIALSDVAEDYQKAMDQEMAKVRRR